MSLFKKPKRNFRNRRKDSDIDGEKHSDEENDAKNASEDHDVIVLDEWPQRASPAPEKPAPVKKIKKKKKDKVESSLPRVASGTSVLSFEEDLQEEGEEVFKIKRSSHSRKVAKQLKRESKKEKEERHKQERESQNSSKRTTDEKQTDNLKNGGSADEMDMGSEAGDEDASDDEGDGGHKFNKPSFRDLLQSGKIPDATLIHMARKRRQMVRERGDFIPVDDTVRVEQSKSRLVREEDHDHSEDSDEERVSFSVNRREEELRKMQSTMLAAAEESNSEGSDHGDNWEMQQIRKGVGASQSTPAEDLSNYQQLYGQQQQYREAPQGPSSQSYDQTTLAAATMPPIEVSGITIEQIKKRMTDRLEEMTSVYRAHVHERDDIESRMEFCKIDIEKMEGASKGLEERYQFFQEMSGYVRDLVECLNEKVPTINSLDKLMLNLLQNRADKLVKRRQEDTQDQNQENLTGRVKDHSTNSQDSARQKRTAEREARRARRRRAREAQGLQDHRDGMSTDDEENNSDIVHFHRERDRLLTEATKLFDDVVEDFYRFDAIKMHFEKWKFSQAESYEEAYIGLCLPKLFSPLLRLKLLDWNPLEADCPSFEQSGWYESLMFYGHSDGHLPQPNDCDLKLIPSLVEKVLLPKLAGLAEHVWDPLSARQTKAFVKLMHSIRDEYPSFTADSRQVKQLVKAVVMRMRKTLDSDIYMPLYPPQLLENTSSGTSIFFHRQFWTCFKLLGNMLEWHGIVSDPVLQEMALDCTLNRYLLLALSSGQLDHNTINKCQAIVNLLPKAWFLNLGSDGTLPQLENFCRLLSASANRLQLTAGTGLDKREMRDRIRQISKLFVTIHAMDHALSLATTHNIRINK